MSSLSWIQFSSLHGGSGLCCASLMTSCVCAACSARITVQSLSTNTNPVCSRTETIPIGCRFKVQSRPPQQKHLIEMKLLYYLYSWCLKTSMRPCHCHVFIILSNSSSSPNQLYLFTHVCCVLLLFPFSLLPICVSICLCYIEGVDAFGSPGCVFWLLLDPL